MNVDTSMCASSGQASHWEQIDWAKCEGRVGRLQARIVKATREGCWGKVKTLQRLLTCSFSGKALAVRRVTENQGRRTPGVDSVSWTTPADKLTAIESLQRRHYRPLQKHCFPALSNRAWRFATKTDQRTADGKRVWLRLAYRGEAVLQSEDRRASG